MEALSANDPPAVGEFQLRARLGAGGMGLVYLGYSPAGRAVAIKVVHPELARDAEFRQRFAREVAAARAVSGMYTAPVVAAGLDDDPPWLATAFVPGPSLADVIARHGPLPEPAVWRLAAGLAEALRAVHACSLVHRDLKPANVLLAADGPHVIDFGISRAFEGTSVTAAGMMVGTPGYMSPEQAEGAQAGPASDVFSLGCVLAYAATGNAPFGGGSAASVLYRVVTAQPDLTGIPGPLRDVVSACLSKDPSQRPGLTALGATISQAGPAMTATPVSFWPDPVAGVIQAASAYPTPTQVRAAPAGLGQPGMAQSGTMQSGTGRSGMAQDGYHAMATASMAAPRPALQTAPARPAPRPSYTPAPLRPQPPTSVLAAAWLMYCGAAFSLLSTLVTLATVGQVKAAFLARHPLLSGNAVKSVAAVASVEVLIGGGAVIALWLWLAFASKQGRPWARTVGTVLFGVDTLALLVTLGSPGIGGTKGIGVVIWLIGLVTVILLWQRRSSEYFSLRR
jgi:hypothetical protein